MTAPCEETEGTLAMYVDGELDAAEAEAFALHLASCAACRDALHEALQLVAVESRAVEARAKSASPHVVREPWASDVVVAPAAGEPSMIERARARRSGLRRWVVAGVAVAAAVAVILAWPRDAARPQQLALVTAPARSLEGRVSYPAADQHRAYAVVRAGTPAAPADAVSLEALAQLEQRGDRHGVAAGYLLRGDASRAGAYLDGAGPDVAADRALAQLLAGHPDDALIALADVLAAQPRHPQALWNRALALRDLGLGAAAAGAFDAVAALGEPGWADEARTRAERLRAEVAQRQARFDALFAAGKQLAVAPTGISAELARQIPGATRVAFYDALRAAPTAGAARALAPLAGTLDAIAGNASASAEVERVAQADWSRRAPLVARYAKLVAEPEPRDPRAAQALRDALRTGQQDDLRFDATLRLAGAAGPSPAELATLREIADARHDPWLAMIATEEQLRSQLAAAAPAAAVQQAEAALAACTSSLDLVCARVALLLGNSYAALHRLDDARRVLGDGLARARRGNEWIVEAAFFVALARAQGEPGTPRLPVARAYLDELQRRRSP